jgi:2-amino-4-hydroxy-6-hydroxymethyldihydropteridine diphosphokinase
MTNRPVIAYIGVGSNIEPETNIPRAMDILTCRCRVTATSTFYRTPAISRPDQPDYFNGVWRVETSLTPRDLKFGVLRHIEDQLGRVRGPDKYAPRTIDLDVLLCGREALDDPDCPVPAPEIRKRPFLVTCLLELEPDLVLPDTNEPLTSLLGPQGAQAYEPAAELTSRLRRGLGPAVDRAI